MKTALLERLPGVKNMKPITAKTKIFLVVNETLRGGGQRIVIDEARRINPAVYEVAIVQLKSNSAFTAENLDTELAAANVRVIDLGGTPGTTMRDAARLFRLLRKERPHIVHTFLPYAGVIGRVVARFAGVPRIFSTQCNLRVAYSWAWFALDAMTLPLAHAWVAVTEGIERSYASSALRFSTAAWHAGRRHFTICAGVDLASFDVKVAAASRDEVRASLGIAPDEVMVIMVARLIPWKGHEDLVASMSYLPKNYHVVIVGWGPLEATLQEDAVSRGVAARLHILGARNDVPALLKASDVFAATHNRGVDGTVWMGANIAQMEACAAGVPSMSTDIPYITELIEDKVTGLIARCNDPEDIARAITTLGAEKATAAQYAQVARLRVEERYSMASMMMAYETLYRLALSPVLKSARTTENTHG